MPAPQRVDVNAFLGAYPWRRVPGTSPEALTKALDRVTIDSAWVTQVSRNLTDATDGFLRGKRLLIHDRDPRFTGAFGKTLAATGVHVVRLPPHSPNLNAYAERFVRSIKESCVDRLILVGEDSLRRAVAEFMEHYHRERNHQGLGNQLIVPLPARASATCACCLGSGSVAC
jgi:transposase InsO family protein